VEYLEVGKSHHGQTILLPMGSTLKVRLKENPTTGYRWEVEGPGDEYMQISSVDFDISDTAAIGAGGVKTFSFVPVKSGRHFLSLKLWCPWEDMIVERFQLWVEVQGAS
jgi:inhibitor of cysteine peptidase